jgi:hypothetical protein
MSFPINVTIGIAVTNRTNISQREGNYLPKAGTLIWVMMPDSSSKLNIDIQTRVSSHLNGNPNFRDNDAWWYFRTEQIS